MYFGANNYKIYSCAPFTAGIISHSKLSEKIKSLGFFPPDIEDKVLQYAEFCKFLQDNLKEHPLMPYILTKVSEIGQVIQSQKRHWDRWKMDEINLNLSELGTQLDILNGMQNSMVKHELQLATSQVQKQEWEQRYRMTRKQNKTMEKELRECMRKLSSQDEELKNYRQLLKEKEIAILQAEQDNDALQVQCDTIEDAKIDAEKGQVHLSEQLEKSQRDVELAQRVIKELQNEREQWFSSRKYDCQQLKMYQMEKEAQNSKFCELHTKLENLNKSYEEEICRNKELMKRIEDMNTRQEELSLMKQQENTALRIHLQKLEESLQREKEDKGHSEEMFEDKYLRMEKETQSMKELVNEIENRFRKEREAFTRERDDQIKFWKEKWQTSEQKAQEAAQKNECELRSTLDENSKLSNEVNVLQMQLEQKELERQESREIIERLEGVSSAHEKHLKQMVEVFRREGSDTLELPIHQIAEVAFDQKNLSMKKLQVEKEALKRQLGTMKCKVEELEKNAQVDRMQIQKNEHADASLYKANDAMSALATDFSDRLVKLQRENQEELERVNHEHHATVKSLYLRIDELEHSKRILTSKQAEMEEEITELQEAQENLIIKPHMSKGSVDRASQTATRHEDRNPQTNGFPQQNHIQTKPISHEKSSDFADNLLSEKRELELELGQTRQQMHLLTQKVIEYEKQQDDQQSQTSSTQLQMSSSDLHHAKYDDLLDRYNHLLHAYDELQSERNKQKADNFDHQYSRNAGMTQFIRSHRPEPESSSSETQSPNEDVFFTVKNLQFELNSLSAEKKRVEYDAHLLNEQVETQTIAIDRLQQMLNEQRESCVNEIQIQLGPLQEENAYLSELVANWRNAYEEKASNFDAQLQILDEQKQEISQLLASRKTLEQKLDEMYENKLKVLEELDISKNDTLEMRRKSHDLMTIIKKQEFSCQKLNDLIEILRQEAQNAGVNVESLHSDWRSLLIRTIQSYKEKIAEITDTKHTKATSTNWKAKYLQLKETVTTLYQEKDDLDNVHERIQHMTYGGDAGHIAHSDSDKVRLLNEHLTDLMKQNVRLQHRKEYYKTMSQSHKLKEEIDL
ncbi:unnamed protein product [Albugo candida]|uniref:Uncharacterized protein n=1 Tax=Albugo candida TaxID=65357 RepID=A0A024GP38_9STRA|nr:unnamed protein product [Albugo candida]|eukprot:CCI48549.1 unnamed protein product [Albugo candida]